MSAVKLQVVTRFLPVRGEHGGCTYLCDLLEYLKARGWDIECLYLNEAPGGSSLVFEIPEAVKGLVTLRSPGNVKVEGRLIRLRGLRKALKERLVKGPAPEAGKTSATGGSDRLPSRREIAFAANRASRFKPGVVLADFTFLAGVLPETPSAIRAILTHDVLHERVNDFKKFGLGSAWSPWTETAEAKLLARADIVVAISEEEGESFRRMNAAAHVLVAPMSVRLPGTGRSKEPQAPGRCMFVGGSDAHNVHGLKWFLSCVWPEILARMPAASLHVCGGVRSGMDADYPNVAFLGHVPDLAREYAAAEVCVVPVLAGSGIKIKLVEALSYGRACVTTPQGLRGLGFLREGLLVAEDAGGFAEGVLRILSDAGFRRNLEREGARAGAECLSPEKCYGPFARAVEKLLEEG